MTFIEQPTYPLKLTLDDFMIIHLEDIEEKYTNM